MELPLPAAAYTGSKEMITVWDAKTLARARHEPNIAGLCQIMDQLGVGSKASQGLNHVLTSAQKLREAASHRLYLLCSERAAIGIIKVGVKKLFIRRRSGQLVEMEPLCVLDFYIHEREQRSGYGRVLFEFMLRHESVHPARLGIDRPSSKFIGFLRKHYGLTDYEPQTNNFVVFNQYFDEVQQQQHHLQQADSSRSGGFAAQLSASGSGTHQTEPAFLRQQQPQLLHQQQQQQQYSQQSLSANRVSAGKMMGSSAFVASPPPLLPHGGAAVPLVGMPVNGGGGRPLGSCTTAVGGAGLLSETLPAPRYSTSTAFMAPPNQPGPSSSSQQQQQQQQQQQPQLAGGNPPRASSRDVGVQQQVSSAGRRVTSPTRSAVGYNIITLANGAPVENPSAVPPYAETPFNSAPMMARSAVVGGGRRSGRNF